jgi:hypothetical protein
VIITLVIREWLCAGAVACAAGSGGDCCARAPAGKAAIPKNNAQRANAPARIRVFRGNSLKQVCSIVIESHLAFAMPPARGVAASVFPR